MTGPTLRARAAVAFARLRCRVTGCTGFARHLRVNVACARNGGHWYDRAGRCFCGARLRSSRRRWERDPRTGDLRRPS